MKKKRRKQAAAATTEEKTKARKRKPKPDEGTAKPIKSAKAPTRKRVKRTEAAVPESTGAGGKVEEGEKDEEFEPKTRKARSSPTAASLSGKALNERVRQQRFSGYNTRSSRGAKPAGGPQDKIIRIDPPPTRRKRRTASAGTTDESKEDAIPKVPQRMKAEAEAVELCATLALPMRPSAVAAGHHGSCRTSEDANFSFSGDESALSSSSLDCHGEMDYESDESVVKCSSAGHINIMDSGVGVPVGLHHQYAQ
jgi:hypothetical protein